MSRLVQVLEGLQEVTGSCVGSRPVAGSRGRCVA